jgi:hypothetical protein
MSPVVRRESDRYAKYLKEQITVQHRTAVWPVLQRVLPKHLLIPQLLADWDEQFCAVNDNAELSVILKTTIYAHSQNSICFGWMRWGAYLRRKDRPNSFANSTR